MLLLGMDSMLCLEGSTSAVTSDILGLIHLAGIPGLTGLARDYPAKSCDSEDGKRDAYFLRKTNPG